MIMDGRGDKEDIEKRVEIIDAELESGKGTPYEREKLQERKAKLVGGIAVIKVGGASEYEQKEKQDRVEDALGATRAAAEEGIIPGCGTAYIRAKQKMMAMPKPLDKSERNGWDIVMSALDTCCSRVAENAGYNGRKILNQVSKLDWHDGFNAATGKYGDLMDMRVIDPTKVSRVALENAASVAAMFLTLEVAIVDEQPMDMSTIPQMND